MSAAQALPGVTNAFVEFTDDNLARAIHQRGGIRSGQPDYQLSTNRLTASIQLPTGLWLGRVNDPTTGHSFPFQGAFLQKQNLGVGYFLHESDAGPVLLLPSLP
jgi:hypothetical protein